MKRFFLLLTTVVLNFPVFSQTFGNAIELDGTNDFAVVPHHSSLNPGNGSWSVAFWLKAADKPQISPVVLKRFPAGGYTMYAYCFGSGDPHNADSGKKIRINHIEDAGITERSGLTPDDYIDGDWHHYVIIADKAKNGIIIYVDGQEVDFSYAYNLGGWPTVENEEPLYIARGSGETYLEGALDELSIWNKAISPELIKKMQTDTLSLPYYNSVDSGLVAYYRFDLFENKGSGNGGSDDICDFSFYQNHADIEGEPVLVESTILPSNNASLSNIQINNESLLEFNVTTLNYVVKLPIGTTIIPELTAILTDSAATVVITQASDLPGTATILVTAEDGVTQQTYSVEFTIAPNNVASLSNILIDDVDLTGFVPTTLDYNTELPYGTTIAPTVSATPIDSNATVVITTTPELPGTATILVTAEDGTTQQTYTVEFTVTPNDDATLSSIQVNSEELLTFNPDTLNYTVEIPAGSTSIPVVSATLTDESAEINIIQAAEIPGTATITVTAENGETQKIYSLSFSFVTWLTDFNLKNSLNIFPNPTTGKFSVQSSVLSLENTKIEIYDLTGKKLLEKQIPDGNEIVEIDVSELKTGIYFCKVITNKILLTKKIIIQK